MLRKLLSFTRYFLRKRRELSEHSVKSSEHGRITKNNGYGNHSQEAELGTNQGTFPVPGVGDPGKLCPARFQN